MGISKAWLLEQIDTETNIDAKLAYKKVYAKLVEPPKPKPDEKLKIFDPNKVYGEIIRFYMDKKGYTKEQANDIAMKIVAEQQQKRMDAFKNA